MVGNMYFYRKDSFKAAELADQAYLDMATIQVYHGLSFWCDILRAFSRNNQSMEADWTLRPPSIELVQCTL